MPNKKVSSPAPMDDDGASPARRGTPEQRVTVELGRLLGRAELAAELHALSGVEAIRNLKAVRDGKQYHAVGYDSFEAFLDGELGWSKSKASELISRLEALGADGFDAVERLRLGYREVRAIRKLDGGARKRALKLLTDPEATREDVREGLEALMAEDARRKLELDGERTDRERAEKKVESYKEQARADRAAIEELKRRRDTGEPQAMADFRESLQGKMYYFQKAAIALGRYAAARSALKPGEAEELPEIAAELGHIVENLAFAVRGGGAGARVHWGEAEAEAREKMIQGFVDRGSSRENAELAVAEMCDIDDDELDGN